MVIGVVLTEDFIAVVGIINCEDGLKNDALLVVPSIAVVVLI